MNIAYFRKSTSDFKTTVINLKNAIKEKDLQIIGETELPNNNGLVIHVCSSKWLGNLITSDKNLIGLLPCSLVITGKHNEVTVGVADPSILGSVTQNPAIHSLAQQAGETLKYIVNKGAGVGELKPKTVKIYSTLSCPYCKMEKSWLDSKKVEHEIIYVDQNQKAAEEMVAKTGQMGVPVTEIQYEDAEPDFIIGFDRNKLASILKITE